MPRKNTSFLADLRARLKKPDGRVSSEHAFLLRKIKEACQRDARNEQQLRTLEERLRKNRCSISRKPVLSCLQDIDQLLAVTEHVSRIKGMPPPWQEERRQLQAKLKVIDMRVGRLKRRPTNDGEIKRLEEEKRVVEKQVLNFPSGRSLKEANYDPDLRTVQDVITLRTFPMDGEDQSFREHWINKILAACMKNLVERGFGQYESWGCIISGMVEIFCPDYGCLTAVKVADGHRTSSVYEAYRNLTRIQRRELMRARC